MSQEDDGNPAFPVQGNDMHSTWLGMSLRDYFAAKAMQGLLANDMGWTGQSQYTAESAYTIADAMIKVRAKQSTTGAEQ